MIGITRPGSLRMAMVSVSGMWATPVAGWFSSRPLAGQRRFRHNDDNEIDDCPQRPLLILLTYSLIFRCIPLTSLAALDLSPAKIADLNSRFESADPRDIVRWAVDTFGDGLSVGASFGGASGMAILHMVAQLKPNVHVFVLDTDYLFEETQETMRRSVPAL